MAEIETKKCFIPKERSEQGIRYLTVDRDSPKKTVTKAVSELSLSASVSIHRRTGLESQSSKISSIGSSQSSSKRDAFRNKLKGKKFD